MDIDVEAIVATDELPQFTAFFIRPRISESFVSCVICS